MSAHRARHRSERPANYSPTVPSAAVNGLEICYETDGSQVDPPLLLIAGLGVQLIDWPPHFVCPLVEAGHHVIRYDNRDVGLSTTFDGAPNDPHAVMDALLTGRAPDMAYTIADMADDGAGLLDALGIDTAHVVGNSMGGMIAQELAIRHPTRVRSLTSIMSTTGAVDVGQPTPDALAAIMAPGSGPERDAVVAKNLANAEIWASPGHFDRDRVARQFERSWDRAGGAQAENTARHFCAIVGGTARDEHLAALSMPALVVHGTADPLITPSGGDRTAACLGDAELLRIEGMGHDLVPAFSPTIVDAITGLVRRTEAATR